MEHDSLLELQHSHNFLGEDHSSKEWRTWAVIFLCTLSMVIEIVCGVRFGSLALVADGIHMSTHALAFFITASAYSFSRVNASNPKYVFGTGKIGELSSFTCAIILLAISLVIVYEGISQFISPVKLDFIPALVVSFIGLSVNIASAFLLGLTCGEEKKEAGEDFNHHGHGHGHSHGHSGHEFLKDFEDEDEDEDQQQQPHDDHDHRGHEHSGHDHSHGHHGETENDHGHDHDHAVHLESFDVMVN
jgi:Co/Zn/Cd efflux system component